MFKVCSFVCLKSSLKIDSKHGRRSKGIIAMAKHCFAWQKVKMCQICIQIVGSRGLSTLKFEVLLWYLNLESCLLMNDDLLCCTDCTYTFLSPELQILYSHLSVLCPLNNFFRKFSYLLESFRSQNSRTTLKKDQSWCYNPNILPPILLRDFTS